MSVPPPTDVEHLCAYEQERAARILRNRQVMEEMGLLGQATLFQAGFKAVKAPRPRKKAAQPSSPCMRRASTRLANMPPENRGLTGDEREHHGRLTLEDAGGADASHDERWAEYVSKHRCDSASRGSVYDSRAGICCHFCRQKKLCGEPDCKRCIDRNPDIPCIGKSECSRCQSATGRFCRACLLVRYGEELESVRAEMAAGTWLCPHCYEEDHADEAWICNSSICMTRRGLKPTGIAIFEAKGLGYASVAHFVQGQILARKGGASASGAAGAAEQLDSAESAAPHKMAAKAAQQTLPMPAPPVTPGQAGAEAAQQGPPPCVTAVASPGPGGGESSAAADRGVGTKIKKAGKENITEAASPAAAPITPTKRRLEQHLPGSEGRIRGRPTPQARQAMMTPPAERPAAENHVRRVTRSSCRRLIT